jgi:hypothetical protein
MLKLEIRKRVRVEEIKMAAWQQIRQEQARAEPQEGLFANLEAKLVNILDAVGRFARILAEYCCQEACFRVSAGVRAYVRPYLQPGDDAGRCNAAGGAEAPCSRAAADRQARCQGVPTAKRQGRGDGGDGGG